MSKYCKSCLRKAKGKVGDKCPCGNEWSVCKNVRVRAGIVTRIRNQRNGKKTTARSFYKEYLESKLWQSIRSLVLIRDSHKCCACERKATHVHHRDYDSATLSGKALDRLVSMCRNCHRAVHRDEAGKLHGLRDTDSKLVSMCSNGLPVFSLSESPLHREDLKATA